MLQPQPDLTIGFPSPPSDQPQLDQNTQIKGEHLAT
jgi:hypothetical protein